MKKIAFQEKCTHCGKIITGLTENQALWNLSVHIMSKHGKEKGDKENGK